jgi:hypothetical protein
MTDAQWAVIKAAAAAREVYPSTYLRTAALRQARAELAQSEPRDRED